MLRLQTLFGKFADKNGTPSKARRGERLIWATTVLGREVLTFNDVTKDEATKLIQRLHGALGIPDSRPPRRQRSSARAAGTEGRRYSDKNSVSIAEQQDLDRIAQAKQRLGWSEAQFESWLRGPASPLKKQSNPQIRTKYEANRVWWAMKGMLKSQGKWK